ncbi:MAG: sigma-70 family RNA polymerase sigma factor [Haliscomenobacter sp.]|nr:sigma-70 family RNA polymerase sigma factor [Haliscomenobacter sp.]MBK7475904.1 sigma-70 family RNA polymerase sigma factor [Haliscomenobacter sp.]MBK8879532.1 sigma-70 family RNA polymerase sigma factor [Haliscomenobacter sp.]
MTEQDLVRGCIQGKRKFQEELFQRYAGKMLAVCMRYARHRMEAEDMLQDAFVKVFEHIGQFQFKGALEGWIRRIVVNTAIKAYDRKSFTHEQIGIDPTWDSASDLPLSDMQLQEKDLLNMINRLPDGYRIVFNLYALEGYSHQEIAEMLGIQESTSRSQLVKARKQLQTQLFELHKVAV